VTFTDEEMRNLMENVSVSQQKRINAEREQLKTRSKLSSWWTITIRRWWKLVINNCIFIIEQSDKSVFVVI
jgi:hypothetical protein